MDEKIVLRLIELIKNNELIWRLTDPRNKLVKRKAKVWKYIAHECGLTVVGAKKKWKGLKDSYFRRISRKKILKKSKIKPDENYKYNILMSFLKDYKSKECQSIDHSGVENTSESLPNKGSRDFASQNSMSSTGDLAFGLTSSSNFSAASDFSSISSESAPKKTKKKVTKGKGRKLPRDSLSHSRQTRSAAAQDSFSNPHQTIAVTEAADQKPSKKLNPTNAAAPQVTSVHSALNMEDHLFCRSLVAKMMTFPLEKKNEAKIEMMKYLCLIEEDTQFECI